MNKVVKKVIKFFYWFIWLLLVILWNYGFPEASPFQDVLVAVFLSILFSLIQLLQLRYLQKSSSRSKFRN
jgi:Na+/H+-dicarboxylate symporter